MLTDDGVTYFSCIAHKNTYVLTAKQFTWCNIYSQKMNVDNFLFWKQFQLSVFFNYLQLFTDAIMKFRYLLFETRLRWNFKKLPIRYGMVSFAFASHNPRCIRMFYHQNIVITTMPAHHNQQHAITIKFFVRLKISNTAQYIKNTRSEYKK